VAVELHAWIFDAVEHRSTYGIKDGLWQGSGTLWNPAMTDSGELLGPDHKPWKDFWPEMLKRTPPIWEGLVRVSKQFELVQELPASFPLAVHSPDLDKSVGDSFIVNEFSFQPNWVCYSYHMSKPLPVPKAGTLSFRDPNGELLAESALVLGKGTTTGYVSSCRDIISKRPEWTADFEYMETKDRQDWKVKKTPPNSWWAKIDRGEGVESRVRFAASRDRAAATPGFNSYWDGTLEFKGTAKKKVLSRR
jgi:hypothetical protein